VKFNISGISNSMLWLLILGFMSASMISCVEKAAQQPTPTSSTQDDDDDDNDNDNDNGTISSSGTDACKEFDDGYLSDFDTLITMLCGNGDHSIKSLRRNTYSGSGTPAYVLDDEDKSGISGFSLSSAMEVPLGAEDYYNLMKLKFTDPDGFLDEGYAVGDGVEYTISENSQPVRFTYTNTKYEADDPSSLVSYEAESYFVDRYSSKNIYVIASDKTRTIDTLEALTALIVIVGSGSGKSEVFSISLQEMQNDGEHDISVSRMKDSSKSEIEIAYDNAERKNGN
jgi:hypothetical protein